MLMLGALCCASACEGAKAPAGKSDADKPGEPAKVEKAEPAKVEKAEPVKDGQNRTPAVVVEAEGPGSAPGAPVAAPAWFDAAKIDNSTLVKQMASEGTIAGGQATAMILELEAGTTPEQCVDKARAVLGETLPEVPEATSADGRLMVQGKTADYHYTVVCGDANGKPTMYMSYTAPKSQ